MKYKLKIEGGNDTVTINDAKGEIIRDIEVEIYQNDKAANDRSEQLFNTIIVKGVLNDKSQAETKKMFDWSMKTDKANAYKTVSIQISNGDELLRDYFLKDMFCTSYKENFDEYSAKDKNKDSIGSFELEMKQRKGSIDTIKVEC